MNWYDSTHLGSLLAPHLSRFIPFLPSFEMGHTSFNSIKNNDYALCLLGFLAKSCQVYFIGGRIENPRVRGSIPRLATKN